MPDNAERNSAEIAAALSRASFRLTKEGAADAAAYGWSRLTAATATLDNVDNWKTALAKMDEARTQLREAQDLVRLVAMTAAVDEESLLEATKVRNEARIALVRVLDDALSMHEERRAEDQRQNKVEEAASLQQQQAESELTLTKRLRLERLRDVLLPTLDEWVVQIGRVREEREDFGRHVSGEPPSLEDLHEKHEALKKAKRTLRDSTRGLEDAREDGVDLAPAQAALKVARRAVQAAEKALHQARFEAATLASAHFPELFAREVLLRVGKADGLDEDEVRAVLVERELAHYEREARLSDKDARHEVWRASYDGEACVLKEYKLDSRDEWKALVKEVTVLRRLASCPYVADVQAVFETPDHTAAYVQLPYYNGGDMLQWLTKTAPEVWRRKALLGQLCEALRHVHSHGLAHGDVKLENTLVSLEGERAMAHLADFESARRQRTTATRSSLSASTGGSNAFTELYVAPEILQASRDGRERDAKPTAMGDMFSYGVCCLFACCLPADASAQQQAVRRFAGEDGRQLARWSRDAATLADEHLTSLLDSLLAVATTNEEALARRLSASQTLRHAFLDTAAALEVSARAQQAAAEASMQAQQTVAAASHEAAQQMAAVEREAARLHREAAWREAELRRRQAEQEEALEIAAQQSERDAAAKRNEIQREQRRLEQERQRVQQLSESAAARTAELQKLTAEEERVARECAHRQAEAERAEAKARTEREELRTARTKARVMPDYWEKHIANSSPDGFAAIALDRTGRDRGTWAALERLLQTDPVKLKQSGADRRGTTHDRLKLACAWRLENSVLWEKYMVGVQEVMNGMKRIRQGGVASAGGVPPLTRRVADALPGDLRVDVNEAFLMHGTNAGVLINILSAGMNERFAGTAAGAAYGEGSYLAEDAGKNDQYTKVDPQYDGSSELHKRLYAHGARHQGKVFYILACRVALGHQVRTQQNGQGAKSTDNACPVFPISFRELSTVHGISPPVHHHSLLADVMDSGARYREYIVFHSEYIYPEYLLAYQRFDGDRGPIA